jgi:hypothetical protein
LGAGLCIDKLAQFSSLNRKGIRVHDLN